MGKKKQMRIKITSKMHGFLTEQNNLGYVATIDQEGRPNIAPKAILAMGDDTLMYADLFVDRTSDNILHNNQVAVAVINPIQCSGYQFKGQAVVLTRGAPFEIAKQRFGFLGFKEPVHAIELKVDEIFFFEQGPESKMEAA